MTTTAGAPPDRKPPRTPPDPAEVGRCVEAVARLVRRHRRGGEMLAEAAGAHARMLCDQYPPSDVLASYTAQAEGNAPPAKWGNSVATNLANRVRRAGADGAPSTPKGPQPMPEPKPLTDIQVELRRRRRAAGL